MKLRTLSIVVSTFAILQGNLLYGQDKTFTKKGDGRPQQRSSIIYSDKPVFIDPAEVAKSNAWDVTLRSLSISHGTSENTEDYLLLKQKMTQKKQLWEEKTKPVNQPENTNKSNTIPPEVELSFKGNSYNGYTPPDNDIAVSDDGYVVSVTNSEILFADQNGNVTFQSSFANFYSYLNLTGTYFDPKVIYDPVEDKFILVVLNGNSPSNSKVVVSFSSASNPANGFWTYYFDGNVLGNNTWFDFPSIGITNDELYVSGNLFDGSNSFDQAIIWQIDKTNGFTGGTINWVYWHNLIDANSQRGFTLVPISYGFNGYLSPGIYFVSSYSGGGSAINLWWTTANQYNNPSFETVSLSTGAYGISSNASQLGTTETIRTNDCRVLDGYYSENMVHFTLSTADNSGFSRLYYGRINLSNSTVSYGTFGLTGFDYAFPSLVPFTNTTSNTSAVMGFLRSSSIIYPEFRVVTIDESMNWSNSVAIKNGEGYALNGRWGDYSGISKRNSSNLEIWLSGCYGDNFDAGYSNVLTTWIGKIRGGTTVSAPVTDFFSNTLTVEEGQTVSFFDNSSNDPTSWSWTFIGGSPSSSISQNPQVVYNTAGTYDVALSTSNSAGSDSETKFSYITVTSASNPPIADFAASQTNINEGESITFTDLSINDPTSWNWSFPGANPSSSSQQNPTVTYSSEGTYSITLTVSNTNGSDSETKSSYISVESINPPIADFNSSSTTIKVGENISFYDASTNSPTSWSWSFAEGNPSTSTLENPSVSYSTSGVFDVALTVYNSDGNDTETKVDYITVEELNVPEIDFRASTTSIIEGSAVTFTDNSTNNPTSWTWAFEGGNPSSSTASSPTITYSNTGVYDVTLTASNEDGSSSLTKTDYIEVSQSLPPVADFSANSTEVSEREQVIFTDLSSNDPTAWNWTFVGGSPETSNEQNPTVTYNEEGTYSVILEVTNAVGQDDLTEIDYITVLPSPLPEAEFSVSDSKIDEGTSVTFEDLSTNDPTSWSWTFEGGNPENSNDQNPTILYENTGIYDVTLSVSNVDGSDTEIKTDYIEVDELLIPIAEFYATKENIEIGEFITFIDQSIHTPTNWSWTFQGGTPSSSTEQNPTIQFLEAGSFDISLVISNENGSDSEVKEEYIEVMAPPIPEADFVASRTDIQEGGVIAFSDQSINEPTSWSWTFPGGDPTASNEKDPVVTYNESGTYDVILICSNDYGTDTETKLAYISVDQYLPPDADFEANFTHVVEETQVNFTDLTTNSPTSWSWSFPGGNPTSSTEQNPSVFYDNVGEFNVTLTATNEDASNVETKNDYIFVTTSIELPVASIASNSTTILAGESIEFIDQSSGNPSQWNWSFPGGEPTLSTLRNPTIIYNIPGIYDVTLTATNGGGSNTITQSELIEVLEPGIPEAEFSTDVTEIEEGGIVRFFDESELVPTSWTWSLPGAIPSISTEKNPIVIYPEGGQYNVSLIVQNSFGSDVKTKEDLITVGTVTSIQNDSDESLTIYPNPSNSRSDLVKVSFGLSESKELNFYLVDFSGRVVKHLLFHKVKSGKNELSFNKEMLSPGTYFVLITDNENNVLKNGRVMITN